MKLPISLFVVAGLILLTACETDPETLTSELPPAVEQNLYPHGMTTLPGITNIDPRPSSVYQLNQAPSGHLWVGAAFAGDDGWEMGMYTFDESWTFWTPFSEKYPKALEESHITRISFDEAGHKWFGLGDKLIQYDGNSFIEHPFPPQLSLQTYPGGLRTLGIDIQGTHWVGYAQYLAQFQNGLWETIELPETTGGFYGVVTVADTIWLSRASEIFKIVDGVPEIMRKIPISNESAGVDTIVHYDRSFDIVKDLNDYLYFCTPRGVLSYQAGRWVLYNLENSPLPDDFINTLAVDQEGVLWVGIDKGVWTFDGENWQEQADGIAASHILIGQNGDKYVLDKRENIYQFSPK